MSRRAHSKPSVESGSRARPAGRERSRARVLAVSAAVLLGLAVAAVWGHRHLAWLRPPPKVVSPVAPELLDPEVKRLVERSVAEAEADPRSAELHGRLGMVYEANALWAEARESYAVAAGLEPGEGLWHFHRAIAMEQAGDPSGALHIYRTLGAERPSFAPVHDRLGWSLIASGELDEALAAFGRVIDGAPGSPNGYVGAATALRLQGEAAAAVERLSRALEIDPGHRGARYQLGLAYRTLGRHGEAERELAQGLEAEVRYLPDRLSDRIAGYAVGLAARIEKAEALRRAGRFEEVAQLLEEALATHPDNLTLLNGLAATYLSLGEFTRAHGLLGRALEVDASSVETHLNLAGWALATERPDRAIEYVDRALDVAPRLARLHALRAQALVKERRFEEATASLEEAIRLEVRDPALYVVLGVLYSATGRWEKARGLYERALQSWPDLVPAHLGRCEASLALGDWKAAEEALDRMLALAPDHPRRDELRRRLDARAREAG